MKRIISLFALALLTMSAWAAKTVTLDFTLQGYDNQQEVTSLTIDGVTVTFDKGTNSIAPKYYSSGNAVRLYGGGTLTVSAEEAITQVVFTFGSSDGSNEITSDVGNFDSPTWTGESDKVVFAVGGTSGHRRFSKLVVTLGEGPVDPVDEEAVNVVFALQGYENAQALDGQTLTVDGVTIAYDKGTGSNPPAYYNVGSAVRFYTGNSMTVTAPNGKLITKIVFTYDSGSFSSGCINVGEINNKTWTGENASIVFTNNTTSQVRVASMLITLEDDPNAPESGVETLAAANALEDNAEFTFNGDAVVTVYRNGYLFLRDESGFGQIREVTEGEFENGQVLNLGWNATKTGNDGWVWYTDAADLSASGETNADLAAPIVLTTFPDESMLNAYVVIENQKATGSGGPFPSVPARSYVLPDNTVISRTETLWGNNAGASNVNYNVYGIICKVNGELMLNPVSFAPYVAPEPESIRGDVDKDGFVKISDVAALINYLLNGNDEGIDLLAADCDLSGEIKINDVTTLINFLLSGNWPEPEEMVYTVAGTYNLFEADWDPNYEGNNMTKGDDGIYRLHKAGYFAEGTEIKFKIVQNHSWDHSWPAEDWLLYIPENGAWDFIIKFMPYNNDEDKIAVEVNKVF